MGRAILIWRAVRELQRVSDFSTSFHNLCLSCAHEGVLSGAKISVWAMFRFGHSDTLAALAHCRAFRLIGRQQQQRNYFYVSGYLCLWY